MQWRIEANGVWVPCPRLRDLTQRASLANYWIATSVRGVSGMWCTAKRPPASELVI